MHVSLHRRQAQPAAVVDQRLEQPSDDRGDRQERDEHRDAGERFLDQLHLRRPPDRITKHEFADEKARVVRDLRMLRQEGGQRGIRRQVGLARQQRGVEAEDLPQRWRVLPQQLAQPLPRLLRVRIVGDHSLFLGGPLAHQGHLGLPADRGQGCLQLVGGVGAELAHLLEAAV